MKLPFWGTIFTIIGVLVLCTLGTWQLQRLAWKNDLIAKLDAAYDSPANTPLDLEMTKDFSYGRVEGILLADKAFLIGPRTFNKEIGNDLMVPLKIKDRTLLVRMGWTPWSLEEQPIKHVNGKKVWFEGLIRTPSWNHFTPQNIPEDDIWYRLDIKQIAQAKKLPSPYPFIVRAERASHKYDAGFQDTGRLYPNNNHLQYAAFWFAMALAMIGVYIFRFMIKKETSE